jgi:uncharacterized protein YyaL (SSP411 family)
MKHIQSDETFVIDKRCLKWYDGCVALFYLGIEEARTMANRLANETSPYLLQHADNPVDWYPWGEEAQQRARDEDKPIFLSIGYSACHWCHVMAHESFEDERIAAILNEHFVNVKVDREERPDLDRVYMSAVQAMTGGGGWPMSVFTTPDGQPFYGGTYFPPTARHGMPAFPTILLAVSDAWRNRRQELISGSARVVEAITPQSGAGTDSQPGALQRDTLASAFRGLQHRFDDARGGWGNAPKFPQPMAVEYLLRYHYGTGSEEALRMATQALDAMARGGIYDQLGGGFHRYSVDERWLVPHFEKMLYDNAQLARVYLHAWQVTKSPLYEAVVRETLDYVIREMTDPAGGFYSTQDADSEGEEGKFFLWTWDEVRAVLGAGGDEFTAAYGVTRQGNASTGSAHGFEGKNILELLGSLEERDALEGARDRLFRVRQHRVHPGRDEKVLTSWNGLMLAAFAEAGRVLDDKVYRQIAEQNADFLLRELRGNDGRLSHTWKARPGQGSGTAKINGYLEDYTHLIDGLIELYQAASDPRWYTAARELAETMIARFYVDGDLYDTSDDHETLIVRPRELQDNATPSGNAMAAWALLRLGGLAVEPRYVDIGRALLGPMQPLLTKYPLGFGKWLCALDYALARTYEIAIIGEPDGADTRALLDTYNDRYRPCHVVAAGSTEEMDVRLLQNRDRVEERATAHVCVTSERQNLCLPPVTVPGELEALIERR